MPMITRVRKVTRIMEILENWADRFSMNNFTACSLKYTNFSIFLLIQPFNGFIFECDDGSDEEIHWEITILWTVTEVKNKRNILYFTFLSIYRQHRFYEPFFRALWVFICVKCGFYEPKMLVPWGFVNTDVDWMFSCLHLKWNRFWETVESAFLVGSYSTLVRIQPVHHGRMLLQVSKCMCAHASRLLLNFAFKITLEVGQLGRAVEHYSLLDFNESWFEFSQYHGQVLPKSIVMHWWTNVTPQTSIFCVSDHFKHLI